MTEKKNHQKMSGIGGQAVIEGIMMRNNDKYSVAVRKPDKDIEICVKDYKSVVGNSKLLKMPFVRGIFNFIDSLVIGMSTLMYSADFYVEDEEEEKEEKKSEKVSDSVFKEKAESVMMILTVIFSVVVSVALFVFLPSLLSDLLKKVLNIKIYAIVALIEGILRVMIFLAYIIAISAMSDIKRTYMYHGAEHKCINCIEHGLELNVDNVMKSSRFHKRCGTSFLFIVMIISIFLFIIIPVQQPFLKLAVRLVMIPVVAGISYEILRYAGTHESKLVDVLSAPGICLQRVTTKEPERDMVEVAIKAVEAVFDWKAFLVEYNKEVR